MSRPTSSSVRPGSSIKRPESSVKKSIANLFEGMVYSGSEQVDLTSCLEGKIVGIYFADGQDESCQDFLQKLKDYYDYTNNTLGFEIIFISLDDSDENFKKHCVCI